MLKTIEKFTSDVKALTTSTVTNNPDKETTLVWGVSETSMRATIGTVLGSLVFLNDGTVHSTGFSAVTYKHLVEDKPEWTFNTKSTGGGAATRRPRQWVKENVNYIIAGCLTEENKKGAHATELTMNGLPCEIHTVVGDSLTELSIQCPPGSEPEIYNINDAMAKIDNFKRYTIAFEEPDALASLPGLPSIQRSLTTTLDVDTLVGTDGVSSTIMSSIKGFILGFTVRVYM